MVSYIRCPVCHDDMPAPAARVGNVAVCPSCGASFVIEAVIDGQTRTRRATAADTTVLSDADLQTLRKARGRVR